MTFYLWKQDLSTDFEAQQVAAVEVRDGQVAVLVCCEPGLAERLAELASRGSLPLMGEVLVGATRGMGVEDVQPGDPAFELALAQAAQQQLGYRVSWKPTLEEG